jgi:hypothetical protein
VHVDKAGRDDQATAVKTASGFHLATIADARDAVIFDCDISNKGLAARAITNTAVLKHDIEHRRTLRRARRHRPVIGNVSVGLLVRRAGKSLLGLELDRTLVWRSSIDES